MVECQVSSAPEGSGSTASRVCAYAVLGLFAAVSVASYFVNELYVYLSAYLWFGFVFGMCMQQGRFCFSSAFRDMFAVGVSRMFVGIMIATVFFSLTAALVSTAGMSTFQAAPIGIHGLVAGLIFGVGMVFAGGCASSSLYKTGEGNLTSAIVVVAMGVTQAVFVDAGGWLDRLVPASWHGSAVSKGLPASIAAGSGWYDQYLAGHLWNRPVATFATLLGLRNDTPAGALLGNFLVGVLLPAVVLLAAVYALSGRKGFQKKRKREGKSTGLAGDLAGFWTMLTCSRRTWVVALILGVAAGLHMLVMKGLRMKFGVENAGAILSATGHDFGLSAAGTVHDPGSWAVATHSMQWAGWALNKLGLDNLHNLVFGYTDGIPNPAFNFAGWMSIALIGGAAVAALLNDEFKLKMPTLELGASAVVGGVLMGIGARLALGCNIGAFFTRVANGDPSGWIFGVGMTGGAWIGVKFFTWWTERKMANEAGVATDLQL
jgi:uncharacterized membrane protein YedE/YeeE